MGDYTIIEPKDLNIHQRYELEYNAILYRHKRIRRKKGIILLIMSAICLVLGFAGIIIGKETDSVWALFPIMFGFIGPIAFITEAIRIQFRRTYAEYEELEQLNMAYKNAKMMESLKTEVVKEMKEGR